MDLLPKFSQDGGQVRFDCRMAIFQLVGNRKPAFAGQGVDLGQLGHQPIRLFGSEQPGPLQGAGVRGRAETVEVREPQVEPRVVAHREPVDQRVRHTAFVPKPSHGLSLPDVGGTRRVPQASAHAVTHQSQRRFVP